MVKVKKFVKSFKYSFIGLQHAFRYEQNFRIMLLLVLLSLIPLAVWPMEGWQKVAVIIAGMLMLAVELINTTIERMMDVLLPASLEEIRIIKDVMAGAALTASIGWLIVIIIVFI